MYKSIFRPLLFHLDAEDIHNKIVKYLQIYRHLTPVRKIVSSSCHTETAGWKWRNLTFRNRVGLSAGFDKAASCFDELSDLGFGFIEVGTVPPKEVKGNPCPRIFRLPKEQALISRTGFNNPGKAVFLQNLKRKRFGKYILGININTNHPDNQEQAMTDILDLYCTFNNYADYYTINWGSIAPDILGPILITLFQHKQEYKKPVFLKLPADLTFEKAEEIIRFAIQHHIDGFIACGPTQDRSLLTRSTPTEINNIGAGGISGLPVLQKSLKTVKYLSEHAPKNMLIIGAGGIITSQDAQAMLDAGAHLVQIYSAFIYEGPYVVKRIAKVCKNERTIRLKRTHDPAASSSTLRRDRIAVYSSVSAKSVQTSA